MEIALVMLTRMCTVSTELTVPNNWKQDQKGKWDITEVCYSQTNFCGAITCTTQSEMFHVLISGQL